MVFNIWFLNIVLLSNNGLILFFRNIKKRISKIEDLIFKMHNRGLFNEMLQSVNKYSPSIEAKDEYYDTQSLLMSNVWSI